MDKNRTVKASILIVLLVLALIVIIIMGYYIYKLNNEKNIEAGKVVNLNNEISTIQNTVNNLNEKINNVSNIINTPDNPTNISKVEESRDSEGYIEMTEEKYKAYNNDKYHFAIQSDTASNKDGTVTIKGRVFKIVELGSITKQQYEDLENGKTLTISGYKMTKAKYSGKHDLLLSNNSEDQMYFYVDKNTDGTGNLSYADFIDAEATDIYMKITVDENIPCKYIDTNDKKKEISLKRILEEKWSFYEDDKDTKLYTLSLDDWQLIFKDGKCIGLDIPTIERF